MNKGLIFKPVIPDEFVGCAKLMKNKHLLKTPLHMWTTKQLNQLVELRAIGTTYKNCAKLLGRTHGSVVAAIDTNNLYSKVDKKRDLLISKILNLDESLIKGRLNNNKKDSL